MGTSLDPRYIPCTYIDPLGQPHGLRFTCCDGKLYAIRVGRLEVTSCRLYQDPPCTRKIGVDGP